MYIHIYIYIYIYIHVCNITRVVRTIMNLCGHNYVHMFNHDICHLHNYHISLYIHVHTHIYIYIYIYSVQHSHASQAITRVFQIPKPICITHQYLIQIGHQLSTCVFLDPTQGPAFDTHFVQHSCAYEVLTRVLWQ